MGSLENNSYSCHTRHTEICFIKRFVLNVSFICEVFSLISNYLRYGDEEASEMMDDL